MKRMINRWAKLSRIGFSLTALNWLLNAFRHKFCCLRWSITIRYIIDFLKGCISRNASATAQQPIGMNIVFSALLFNHRISICEFMFNSCHYINKHVSPKTIMSSGQKPRRPIPASTLYCCCCCVQFNRIESLGGLTSKSLLDLDNYSGELFRLVAIICRRGNPAIKILTTERRKFTRVESIPFLNDSKFSIS